MVLLTGALEEGLMRELGASQWAPCKVIIWQQGREGHGRQAYSLRTRYKTGSWGRGEERTKSAPRWMYGAPNEAMSPVSQGEGKGMAGGQGEQERKTGREEETERGGGVCGGQEGGNIHSFLVWRRVVLAVPGLARRRLHVIAKGQNKA